MINSYSKVCCKWLELVEHPPLGPVTHPCSQESTCTSTLRVCRGRSRCSDSGASHSRRYSLHNARPCSPPRKSNWNHSITLITVSIHKSQLGFLLDQICKGLEQISLLQFNQQGYILEILGSSIIVVGYILVPLDGVCLASWSLVILIL